MTENGEIPGNKFGRGIEFRAGEPIQLLKYADTEDGSYGKIVLNPEALNIIQEIREPLAIISVVGSYRRGKSWFANVLHGRHDGFDLGAKVEGCTRGIYMWSPPFKITHKQSDGKTIKKRVIVLDSEGIDDPKQDQNWATKLFILCLASSSTFIYNINGIVGRDDIGKLYLMTDLSKFIQEPENGDFLPRLVILLRDFTLENPDDFKDYFFEKLNNVNPEAATGIRKFFYDFDVYGLPHPGCKRKMLQHMENAETDNLDEEFVDEVENAVKSIYSNLPLKYIGSSTMKGVSLVKFLKDIVERMNSSETSTLLSIPSEYESIIQFVAQEAIKEASIIYKERMELRVNEEGKLPMSWEEFANVHNECIAEANKLFYEKIIGSPTQMEGFIETLNESVSKIKEEFVKVNSEELMVYHEDIAKKFWEKYIKSRLTQEDLFESNEDFQEALKSFELAYESSVITSPEAAKVIASYMKNQYPTAIDYMTQLGRMNKELANAMRAKEDAERLRLEALAREEEFRIEMEAQKREREETERNFKEKMQELHENIEQQNRSHEEMQQRLIEEREHITEKYNQKCDEMQNTMLEQQKREEENRREQEKRFEQMQKSTELEFRKVNDELKNQLIKEKEKALSDQNKFYQKQLADQIAAAQRQSDVMMERMRRDNEDLKRRIDSKKSGICTIS